MEDHVLTVRRHVEVAANLNGTVHADGGANRRCLFEPAGLGIQNVHVETRIEHIDRVARIAVRERTHEQVLPVRGELRVVVVRGLPTRQWDLLGFPTTGLDREELAVLERGNSVLERPGNRHDHASIRTRRDVRCDAGRAGLAKFHRLGVARHDLHAFLLRRAVVFDDEQLLTVGGLPHVRCFLGKHDFLHEFAVGRVVLANVGLGLAARGRLVERHAEELVVRRQFDSLDGAGRENRGEGFDLHAIVFLATSDRFEVEHLNVAEGVGAIEGRTPEVLVLRLVRRGREIEHALLGIDRESRSHVRDVELGLHLEIGIADPAKGSVRAGGVLGVEA